MHIFATSNSRHFHPPEWAARASALIQEEVAQVLYHRGECRVMLTGGTSAERLYSAWAVMPDFRAAHGIHFFFGDERSVAPDHPASNFGMVMRTLFFEGVPEGCFVSRMEADEHDRDAAALRYEKKLRDGIDVLLLGAGDDGHIASIFPGSETLLETGRLAVPVSGPKFPHERLTITPPVIAGAGSVFVLAPGKTKAQVLARALKDPDDVQSLPARLVLGATWLLDTLLNGDGN